ncbi:MAG: hypothetical protein K2M19_05050 [Muribaculaceae bacterium]|nr:hypothetical protein [Muribaculaceae bacterium]
MKRIMLILTIALMAGGCRSGKMAVQSETVTDSVNVRRMNLSELLSARREVELDSVTVVWTMPEDSVYKPSSGMLTARKMRIQSVEEHSVEAASIDSVDAASRTSKNSTSEICGPAAQWRWLWISAVILLLITASIVFRRR